MVELGTPLTVPPLVQGRVAASSTANEPAITTALAIVATSAILADVPVSLYFGQEPFLAGWMSYGQVAGLLTRGPRRRSTTSMQ